MPSKKTDAGREYEVTGKRFVWHPLDDDDQPGHLPAVEIPLRLKLGAIRDLTGRELDATAMFEILERIIPNQTEQLDNMDLNDFQAMFFAWQTEYRLLAGASLGESERSST